MKRSEAIQMLKQAALEALEELSRQKQILQKQIGLQNERLAKLVTLNWYNLLSNHRKNKLTKKIRSYRESIEKIDQDCQELTRDIDSFNRGDLTHLIDKIQGTIDKRKTGLYYYFSGLPDFDPEIQKLERQKKMFLELSEKL